MNTTLFILMMTIIVYLMAMVAIGFLFSKNNSTNEDFYLGGRKMGPFVTAMSAEASDMSSWLLMGLPGLAMLAGIAEPVWTAIGLAVGTWVNWFFVSKRIRRYTAQIGAITIPQFFSKRYHDEKNILSLISATVIVIFFIPYTASGFAACGKLFASLFDADYMVAMSASALVIVLYTITGGFRAVSTTDLIQSIVMTIALISVVVFGVNAAGGWDAVAGNASEAVEYLSLTKTFNTATGTVGSYGFLTIVSTLSWGFGYFGMPHILLRFMAIEDEEKLTLSRRIASVWVVIAMAIAILIGVIGYGITKTGAIAQPLTSGESETIIVQIASMISQHGILAAILAGLILAGILAATMSTADSQMLAAASSISQDVFQDVFGIKLTDKQALGIARLAVVVISVVAVLLAQNPDSSVFRIVSFAWAGFGGAFGGVVLAALFWKRSNMWGALAGMIGGALTVFVWKFLVRPLGGAFDIYELLPAIIVSVVCIVVVSLLTKAPEQGIIEEFEASK
mgnify:CR=1 FL=1